MKIGFKELLARLAKNQIEKITIADVATAVVIEPKAQILLGKKVRLSGEIQVLPNGNLMAVVCLRDRYKEVYSFKLLDGERGSEIATLVDSAQGIIRIKVLPNGNLVALVVVCQDENYSLKLWNAESGREIATLVEDAKMIHPIQVLPTGNLAAVVEIQSEFSRVYSLKLWNQEDGREVATLVEEAKVIDQMQILPNGNLAAVVRFRSGAAEICSIKLWDQESGREVVDLLMEGAQRISEIKMLPNGNLAAFVSSRMGSGHTDIFSLILWNPKRGKKFVNIIRGAQEIDKIKVLPSGNLIAVVGKKSGSGYSSRIYDLKLWEQEGGSEIATIVKGAQGKYEIKVLLSGNLMAVVSSRSVSDYGKVCNLRLYDQESGREIATLIDGAKRILQPLVLSNGNLLALVSSETGSDSAVVSSLKLWDQETGREIATLEGDFQRVERIRMLPNDRLLAIGEFGSDSDESCCGIKLWNLKGDRGVVTIPLKGMDGIHGIFSTMVLSNGNFVAAVRSKSGRYVVFSLKLWNLESGEEIATLVEGSREVPKLLALSDGSLVVASVVYSESGSYYGVYSIKLWDQESGREIAILVENVQNVYTLQKVTDDRFLASVYSADSGFNVKVWPAQFVVVNDLELKELLTTVAQSSKVKELDLSAKCLSDCCSELLDLLQKRTDFVALNFGNAQLNQNVMLAILLILHSNTVITELDMSGNSFGSRLAETHINAQITKLIVCNRSAKEGVRIEEVDENQNTFLHVIALLNNLQSFYQAFRYLEKLYDSNQAKLFAFLERKNREEKQVLDCADVTFVREIAKSLHFTLIKYLNQFGFDFNTKFSEDGDKTILHMAILNGKTDIAVWMIENCKLNLNITSDEGRGALHYAALKNNVTVAKALVAKGADVMLEDGFNFTALDIAKKEDFLPISVFLKKSMETASVTKGGKGAGMLPEQHQMYQMQIKMLQQKVKMQQQQMDMQQQQIDMMQQQIEQLMFMMQQMYEMQKLQGAQQRAAPDDASEYTGTVVPMSHAGEPASMWAPPEDGDGGGGGAGAASSDDEPARPSRAAGGRLFYGGGAAAAAAAGATGFDDDHAAIDASLMLGLGAGTDAGGDL